jgi:hypothetical protein
MKLCVSKRIHLAPRESSSTIIRPGEFGGEEYGGHVRAVREEISVEAKIFIPLRIYQVHASGLSQMREE